METTACFYVCVIIVCISNICMGFGELPTDDEMQQDMYCVGCEATLKAMQKLMSKYDDEEDNMDIKVAEVMLEACNVENFAAAKDDNIPPKHLAEACKFLIEKNSQLLEPLLVQHFSAGRPHMDLSHQVCIDISKACPGVPGHKRFPAHLDSELEFNEETQAFHVKQGRNLRMPHPIKVDDEL